MTVVGEQASRPRRCGTSDRDRDRDWDGDREGDREGDRDEADRRTPRRCRVILYVVGGMLGPGYWLCGVVWDGRLFGKSPAETRFTEFVLASAVVVVASWGLLLILGEAMLFALAVFKADDRERYDIYRNLMILWGYVLTLGIPRHFRKLPAQFGARPDDVRSSGRGGQGAGRSRQQTGRPPEGHRRDGAHHHGGGPAQERQDQRGTGARRRQEPRDRQDGRDTRDRRDRAGYDEARDRTGPRDRQGHTDRSRDGEDARKRTAARERGRPGSRGGAARTGPPGTGAGSSEGVPREGREPPGTGAGEQVASLEAAPRERLAPLGPIFPPRPAAEAETGPVPAPPAASGAMAVTVSSLADTLPAGDTELRNALELLLRYAARCGGDETAVPRPAPPDPEVCDSKPFGIAAEAGGDV
ncbi:MAG: hypothetical protein JWP48_4944 [Actinoallomurus sp.]|nr:hypothetical protein [Actinoallomurus sp.]